MPTQQQQPPPPKPRVIMDPHHRQPMPPRGQRPAGAVKDIRQTKEYKLAARRWISVMVGLPILMYTSWSLYERTYGDKRPKRLVERPSTSSTASPSGLSSGKGEGEGEK
ncbi:hypothetical protein BO83DRAFT_380800 [Aspergillus eucalypticola CBS 122712]|uniref:Uncharacterized protein n=1 Tax=Aspergillus eucalypticola (strain CBS 122712 / IBT 29274) TaxID=1448314 RepID=A0A317UY45_ASPEC|nr:uncharacterized protein BO83DRAFT_380800 [Aspergillus eucalypticola CBS 122712]PWY66973.1 hypothetical protein BO83DRAFT_380800 [Aspergillus eucalypticola CBS 122712]